MCMCIRRERCSLGEGAFVFLSREKEEENDTLTGQGKQGQ